MTHPVTEQPEGAPASYTQSFRFEDPAGPSGAADPAAEAAGGGPMGEADKGK